MMRPITPLIQDRKFLSPPYLSGTVVFFGIACALSLLSKDSMAGEPPIEKVSLKRTLTPQDQAFKLNEIGVELVLKGDKERGHATLVQASQLDPQNPTIYYNLAGLYLNQGNIPKALEAVNRCIALRPEELSFLHRLGEIHFAAKNYADAADIFEQIVEKNPNFNEVLFHLGTVYAMQERWGDAEEVLKRAVELYPPHSSLETNLANVLIMQEKFSEAVKILQTVYAREKTGENALALGIALEGQGDLPAALKAYEEASTLGLKDEELIQRIAALKTRVGEKSPAP